MGDGIKDMLKKALGIKSPSEEVARMNREAWESMSGMFDELKATYNRQREAEGNIQDYEWHWQSDWNGDEVGWDHIDVVGLYEINMGDRWVPVYIDASTGDILEFLEEDEEG